MNPFYTAPRLIAIICIAAILSSCATLGGRVRTDITPLQSEPGFCSGSFVRHDLVHTTMADTKPPENFDSNGAGVALADLDDDGLIDIVLAGLESPVTILWNKGNLRFDRVELPLRRSRAVNAVDVDGDGRLDLVFTVSVDLPSWWRADGPERNFVESSVEEFAVWFYLHAMAWSDTDGDGDLDMIGGTYDQEILRRIGFSSFSEWNEKEGRVTDGGVFFFENTNTGLEYLRLGSEPQSLAIALIDLDSDGRRDAVVGNDFEVPDFVYLNTGAGWKVHEPFSTTTLNTMSFAEGDIDNDGDIDMLAADMKPFDVGPKVDDAWRPIVEAAIRNSPNDGVQTVANVLQVREGETTFVNRAATMGVEATGWTWSVQFGDLDNDGHLDLYAVNGMIATGVFDHLPGSELVEKNLAFRNVGGYFVPTEEWGLGATEGGRGMAMADLDLDGDLDIVVNNFEAPSVLFENRICTGSSLEVDLRWTGTRNIRAIGATVVLETTAGSYTREVRASSGYLSSDPSRVHFGFPRSAEVVTTTVTWPDGARSTLRNIEANSLLTVTR